MTTYREEIRQLDRLATPAPWAREGELYGVYEGGSFRPLGFAPHRPLDSQLIAVYRSAVIQLIEAMDAVEAFALRAAADASAPAAIGIRQVLTILDGIGANGVSFRRAWVELDKRTTPPPWDPGHLVLGMELDAELRSLGIATPTPGDAPLIAVTRIAVPRALEMLAFAEGTISQEDLLNGRLHADRAVAISAEVAAFDQHRASEGRGTGTV